MARSRGGRAPRCRGSLTPSAAPRGAPLESPVAFLCIPQSFGYAFMAGLNPLQGLYSNATAAIPAAALASSRYLQVRSRQAVLACSMLVARAPHERVTPCPQCGCVALAALITGGTVTGLGLAPGSAEFGAAATLLALMVGAVRLSLGLLRGGVVVGMMPPSVLDGFTVGAVWLVFAAQFQSIVGAAPPAGMHFISGAFWLMFRPHVWHLGPITVALITMACILGGRRISPFFPGAVVAAAIGAPTRPYPPSAITCAQTPPSHTLLAPVPLQRARSRRSASRSAPRWARCRPACRT